MKDKEYYLKLVASGRSKKIAKLMATGELQEKLWIVEAVGVGAKVNDRLFNLLVEGLQTVKEQQALLALIQAIGETGRTAAVSQLEYLRDHSEDETVQAAAHAAIKHIRENAK